MVFWRGALGHGSVCMLPASMAWAWVVLGAVGVVDSVQTVTGEGLKEIKSRWKALSTILVEEPDPNGINWP